MLCRFFVLLGYGPSLLGMPDIEVLDILTIHCNTIDTKSSTDQIRRKQTDGWFYPNKLYGKKEATSPQGRAIQTWIQTQMLTLIQ